jgi:hypothetical protein
MDNQLLPREVLDLTDRYNELYAEIYDIRRAAKSHAELDAHPLYYALIQHANGIVAKLQLLHWRVVEV